MLFDLRSQGRKRTVQIVYALLAFVLVIGLVGFGIGGGVGLFNTDDQGNGTNASSSTDALQKLEKKVSANPKDPKLLGQLAEARATYGIGLQGESATLTPAAKKAFQGADRVWQTYLATNPKTVNVDAANAMASVYGPGRLEKFALWADASAVVAESKIETAKKNKLKPEPQIYLNLAYTELYAGRSRQAKLHMQDAVDVALDSQRKEIKKQVAELPKQVEAAKAGTDPATQEQTTTNETITLPK